MDHKLIIVFFASVILSGVLSQVTIKSSHESITVNQEEPYELVCEANSNDIKGCLFTNPAGKSFILWPGASYEGGRVAQKGDGQSTCAVAISKAQDSDNGKWTCQVSVTDATSNAVTASADVDVTVAVPPTTVQIKIADVNAPSEYNVKMAAQKDVAVECIAEEARPPPTFSWYLGEDLLNGDISTRDEDASSGKKNYIETLKYYPSEKHDGKTLRCQVEHQAYTDVQKEGKENEAEVVLKVQYPPQKPNKVEHRYDLNVGQEEKIRMEFSANPKPSVGVWTINGTTVPVSGADTNNMYVSGAFEEKDGLPGQWAVELTINKLSESDVSGQHKLEITNEEGSTEYLFELHKGTKPPPAADSNSLTVGIIVIIVIIVVILVIVIVARAKGMLCFAGRKKKDEDDSEQAMDKEGSDTESAEHHSTKEDSNDEKNVGNVENGEEGEVGEPKKESQKTSVVAKMSNFFVSMKKSVHSKSSKDKYEKTESEMKLNDGDEKKDSEGGEKDDITYADLDDNALSSGNRSSSLSIEDEKTEYAEIKPSH